MFHSFTLITRPGLEKLALKELKLRLGDLCHQKKIRVTSTPAFCSVTLALALSGYHSDQFYFNGFLPQKNPKRKETLLKILQSPKAQVFMDTPYRLEKTLQEICSLDMKREIFLACDLNTIEEWVVRDQVSKILSKLGERKKREFVAILPSKEK